MGSLTESVGITGDIFKGYNAKSDGATFIREGDGVMALNTNDSMGALASTRVSTKDIRALVHQFISEMVQDRLTDIKAAETVSGELARRVEVAVKAAGPRIEREVEASIKEAVRARVQAEVEAMDIGVRVTIQQKAV